MTNETINRFFRRVAIVSLLPVFVFLAAACVIDCAFRAFVVAFRVAVFTAWRGAVWNVKDGWRITSDVWKA